jgi:DNA-binding SARP family transcriptional activator
LYHRAVDLYQGDLCVAPDPHAVIERERLRARYLTLLMRLADDHYRACHYELCQQYVQQLLRYDPCREDAHRLAMRCYVQVGERAQAFRQYRLCQELLRAEFDAPPEPATMTLFAQIRLDPAAI